MKFNVTRRQAGNKSEIKKIRREGNIPAILYSKGEVGKGIIVEGIAFKKLIDSIEPGTLSSRVLTLEFEGMPMQAIVKEVQYEVTTYRVQHLDLEQLHDDVPVTLNIPIKCLGSGDCAGVKLGGNLRQTIRAIKVKTSSKNIPDRFEFDVHQLALGQSLRLSALVIPEGIEPCCNLDEVAVVVSRR